MLRTGIILALLLLSGCATVTRGSTEAFVIESDPLGATATLSSGHTCKTPCSLELKRKKEFTVKIEKDGYEAVEANISSQVAGAGAAGMAGNVLLGGVIGAAVDVGTGATKELKPNPLVVKLIPVSETPAVAAVTTKPAVKVVSLAEPAHFYQPDPASPSGMIFIPKPPPSVERKGIREVRISHINGLLAPPSTSRQLRLPPGDHEITFVRPDEKGPGKSLVVTIEADTEYSLGYRDTDGDWEPVIYEIKQSSVQTASAG